MLDSSPLPKLPGLCPSDPLDLCRRKGQSLRYINGFAVAETPLCSQAAQACAGTATAGIMPATMAAFTEAAAERGMAAGGEGKQSSATGASANASASASASESEGEKRPPWVEFDRQVLRFYGFFKEGVVESLAENYRIRKCVIYYYLSDQSMHVEEPKESNSGIPQGVFLKRHRIAKPSGDGFFSEEDLQVGSDLTLYSRTFHITGCDPYTRSFLQRKGVDVAEDEECPPEPLQEYRAAQQKVRSGGPPKPRNDDLTRFMEATLGRASHVLSADTLQQFVEKDGQVLRFFCIWDDRSTLYGERRPYVLHYFLADDTVEILEVNEPNSGRDRFPLMLKRGKLPKATAASSQGSLMMTSSSTGSSQSALPPAAFVSALDLIVGETISVYNREFFLYDCDEFTKAYYAQEHGVQQMVSIDIDEEQTPIPQMSLPPYNGFGSFEDTMQNCIALIPKPPRKPFHKLMENEKKVLRYIAKMANVPGMGYSLTESDMNRTFILQYFLADDTVSLYEPTVRNSGIIGGKYLERSVARKENSVETYTQADFFIGSTMKISKRLFELVDADEYTYKYMTENTGIFKLSDAGRVLASLKQRAEGKGDALRKAMEAENGKGSVDAAQFHAALSAAGIAAVKQEAITAIRALAQESGRGCRAGVAEIMASLS